MAQQVFETESLSRVEELLDALETRGKNSKEFLALCEELQTRLEIAPFGKNTSGHVGDMSTDLKNRLVRIVKRLEMLETFSTSQTQITSNLQKHIVGADK
jgi:hypothetical protein